MKYRWSYLINNDKRGSEILELIKPHISEVKSVFDFMCGFSPLKMYLPNCHFIGFDICKKAINELKEKYPEDLWLCTSDDKFVNEVGIPAVVDLYLHLGICNGDKSYVSKEEDKNSLKCIKSFSPKIVVLEVSYADRNTFFDFIVSGVVKMGYVLKSYDLYESGIDDKSKDLRLLAVFTKNVR